MMELEDMRCFVAVIESGGFSRAAARLGISKSMVSRRIARMEEDLRTRLISRTTRGSAWRSLRSKAGPMAFSCARRIWPTLNCSIGRGRS